jgi:hypothetical protein
MVPMTTDIAARTSAGKLLAPAAGWTESALPSGPGTVIQYRNNQNSRVVAALDRNGFWEVLLINIHHVVHNFTWSAARLVGDLDDVASVEIITAPAKS